MTDLLLSIIIPTHNRPQLLPRAVESALEQTVEDFEVIVVDDGSTEPVNLPEHPRLRIVALSGRRGVAAARNLGTKLAQGKYVTYLDDDDQLLPHMAAVSLQALAQTTLPRPVAVLSGLEVVTTDGKILRRHLPATLPRGSYFSLEEIPPGQSFFSKQTLVVEREVLLSIGGFDESFESRVPTEMFLRLNPVCSILGLPIVTYRLFGHSGPRISLNPTLRQASFHQLIRKHEALFKAHPNSFANFVYEHARMSYRRRQRWAAFCNLCWAVYIDPLHSLAKLRRLGRLTRMKQRKEV